MLREKDGFYIWPKGRAHSRLSKFFMPAEFECHCTGDCGEQRISIELIRRLDEVRAELGEPISVTSGYRCEDRQEQLRGLGLKTVAAGNRSQHELGNAADLTTKNMAALESLLSSKFDAIGVAKKFLHVDMRSDKKRCWKYD
jgi:uncharacterized protein YcbK (DUF882 family)